jgi:hypothetical protein
MASGKFDPEEALQDLLGREERAREQRAMATRRKLLADLESEYRSTGNPVAVWAAWRLCRRVGQPFEPALPDWVLAYLDGFAGVLREWVENRTPSPRLDQDVGRALGFEVKGKAAHPILAWRQRFEGEEWMAAYEQQIQAGQSHTAAVKTVAEAKGKTEPTVRRRLSEFTKVFGLTPQQYVAERQRFWREGLDAADITGQTSDTPKQTGLPRSRTKRRAR